MTKVKYSFLLVSRVCKRKSAFFFFSFFFFSLSPSLRYSIMRWDRFLFCSNLLHFFRLPRQTSLRVPKGERKRNEQKKRPWGEYHVRSRQLIDQAMRSTTRGVIITVIIIPVLPTIRPCVYLVFCLLLHSISHFRLPD